MMQNMMGEADAATQADADQAEDEVI
jgi:hypothetical protein